MSQLDQCSVPEFDPPIGPQIYSGEESFSPVLRDLLEHMPRRIDDSVSGLRNEVERRIQTLPYDYQLWERMTGMPEMAISTLIGEGWMPPEFREPLRAAVITVNLLEDLIKADAIPAWLLQSNEAFNGKAPADLIREGAEAREEIYLMLGRINHGIFF